MLFVAPAWAEGSGSAAWLSDDRYHGASLSDGLPTVQLTLAWDGADGWYAGSQFTRVRFAYRASNGRGAPAELEAAPYVGYVRALGPRLRVEAGAQYTWFSHSSRYAYPELYAGLSGDRMHARLAWIHDYFGVPGDAWYAELNGDRPLHGPWRALMHVGALRQPTAGAYGLEAQRWRYDLAAGLGVAWVGFDLQATWTTTSANAYASCAPWQCGGRDAWVLRIARNW